MKRRSERYKHALVSAARVISGTTKIRGNRLTQRTLKLSWIAPV